jgi:hypothetical protein
MKMEKFLEFRRGTFTPIKSFKIQKELNLKLWDNFELDEDVRKQLLQIGQDFFEGIEIQAEVKDIVLCGSLCNYNWSEKYSDYDLHITIDFKDVDEDYDLVEKLCDYAKKVWNEQHDIKIKGYEVEVCIQDEEIMHEEIRDGKMGGVYSLLKDKWVKKPARVDFKPNERMIKEKSKNIIMVIDDIIEESNDKDYDELEPKIKKVWGKIKNYRKSGLESESGEFSIGNLVFKLLRRNGYISKVMDLKRNLYDKQFK